MLRLSNNFQYVRYFFTEAFSFYSILFMVDALNSTVVVGEGLWVENAKAICERDSYSPTATQIYVEAARVMTKRSMKNAAGPNPQQTEIAAAQ